MKDPFGPETHNTLFPYHSGKCGHYCWDYDDLWICEDCEEFHSCSCIEKTPEQIQRAEKYYNEVKEYNKKNPIEL